MQIQYDPEKAARNPLIHDGVTTPRLQRPCLLDPHALTHEDTDAGGEERFVTLGLSKQARLLIVVWTERGDRIRLISF